MKKGADVLVVGGGPCGSFSALAAAKLGSEVVVCEEHKEIGVPVHCPGHISVSGTKLLGLRLPRAVIENKINEVILNSPFGKQLAIRFSSPISFVVNRELFDKYLADLAMKAGARYLLKTKVKSLTDSGFVKGVAVRKDGVIKSLSSNIIIDAEGCTSTLLKQTKIQTLDTSMVVNAVQAEVNRVDEVKLDTAEVYLGQRYAPGFFAWVIPNGNSSAKVGLAIKKGDPREYLRKFMHNHPTASKKFRRSTISDLSLHPIPLGGTIPKTYSNGLLIVGDAASQVKPTTGGGVIFGLLCSKIAGEIAGEALKHSDFSETFMSQYQRRWRKLIGSDLALMLRIRKLVNRLQDKKLNEIFDLSVKLRVDKTLERILDYDFVGGSMIRMVQHPNLFFMMLYSIFSSFTSSIH